jgi:hypothetical protein
MDDKVKVANRKVKTLHDALSSIGGFMSIVYIIGLVFIQTF